MELARFTQADPVIPDDVTQNSQALNRYSYAFNNPLKFNDPGGNVPVDLEYSTSDYLTLLSNAQVVTTAKNSYNIAQNSSFNAGGTTVQGSKSSFYGQGTTDINGGSGASTLSGSPGDQ